MIKFNGLVLHGQTNAGKSMIIECMTEYIHPESIPRERDNSSFHLDQLPHATGAIFEESYITPTNVGTWKLLLEGSIIRTDKKHGDKQSIPRISVYITCATPLDNNVQQSESIQITQRINTFYFTKTIDHSDETVHRTMFGHPYIKPPHYLRAHHFAALYLLHYPGLSLYIFLSNMFLRRILNIQSGIGTSFYVCESGDAIGGE